MSAVSLAATNQTQFKISSGNLTVASSLQGVAGTTITVTFNCAIKKNFSASITIEGNSVPKWKYLSGNNATVLQVSSTPASRIVTVELKPPLRKSTDPRPDFHVLPRFVYFRIDANFVLTQSTCGLFYCILIVLNDNRDVHHIFCHIKMSLQHISRRRIRNITALFRLQTRKFIRLGILQLYLHNALTHHLSCSTPYQVHQ